MRINLTSFKGISIIYVAFIIVAGIYFGVLQQFGHAGSSFVIGGKDYTVSPLDIIIIITLMISIVLLLLSLFAFSRKKTVRIFIISLVFFFFTARELFIVLDNFFPKENIYIGNAVGILELFILLSFVLLIYNMYRVNPQKMEKKRS
jgi:hypothetical protein